MLAVLILIATLSAITQALATCDTNLKGFASPGVGTTGGGNASPVTVKTIDELRNATSSDEPGVIIVSGVIETGESAIKIGSIKTVIGKGLGNLPAKIMDGHGVSNVWIDHCDLSDAGGGLLDMTKGSDLITVSWTKFSFTTSTGPRRFARLIGAGTEDAELDRGNFASRSITTIGEKISWREWHACDTGMYTWSVGTESSLLVENNVFENVNYPIAVQDGGDKAFVVERGNVFTNTTGDKVWGVINGGVDAFSVAPYDFSPINATDVAAAVLACVGPKIDFMAGK